MGLLGHNFIINQGRSILGISKSHVRRERVMKATTSLESDGENNSGCSTLQANETHQLKTIPRWNKVERRQRKEEAGSKRPRTEPYRMGYCWLTSAWQPVSTVLVNMTEQGQIMPSQAMLPAEAPTQLEPELVNSKIGRWRWWARSYSGAQKLGGLRIPWPGQKGQWYFVGNQQREGESWNELLGKKKKNKKFSHVRS